MKIGFFFDFEILLVDPLFFSFPFIRNDSSFNFFVFFFVFFINCILKGIFAIGIPSMGAW